MCSLLGFEPKLGSTCVFQRGLSDAGSLMLAAGLLRQGRQGRGAGKEVPSLLLSDRSHLVFLAVIIASVWVKSSWEVVMG